jgi:hypothetical protein
MNRFQFLRNALTLLAIILLVAIAPGAHADLNVNVVNKSGVDSSQVFIMFGAAPLQATATINGARNTPIARGVCYELSTIKDIKITNFPPARFTSP